MSKTVVLLASTAVANVFIQSGPLNMEEHDPDTASCNVLSGLEESWVIQVASGMFFMPCKSPIRDQSNSKASF
jgi:hypothetical protein